VPDRMSGRVGVDERRRRPADFYAPLSCTVVAVLVLLPDLVFGLDQYGPFAQLVSFRPVLAGAVLAGALAVGCRRRSRLRPLVVGPVVVVAVAVALVLPRTVADPPASVGRPFTVVSFNTLEGGADIGALRDLIRTEQPDVVSLSEAGDGFRSRLLPAVETLGYRVHTSTGPGTPDMSGITALTAGRLGDVRVQVRAESSVPYLELSGAGLGDLRVVAFHSRAPLPGLMSVWRRDLAQLPRWCSGSPPVVVAGDFNATLDHSALRNGMSGCADSADQRGAGLIPTWDLSASMRGIGPQIDHVIVTRGIGTESFQVVDIPGSDHRAIVSRLRLPT
jgi:endonuclease/exonuclease/phosphatase (EEP) superfamily protein YafD